MKREFYFSLLVLLMGYAFAKAQTEQLARNYAEQGDYEKAIITYTKALKKQPGNADLITGLAKSYQELEQYDEADKALRAQLGKMRDKGFLYVELGFNSKLQGKDSLANAYVDKALLGIKEGTSNPYRVARTFQDRNLLEEAVKAYRAGIERQPNVNYSIQLARLYGELGEVEKMFESYLDLINKSGGYVPAAQRNFAQYINDDPQNEANVIFRKTLLKRLQTEQNVLYNELLSWLFIQQKQYDKAFVQEKAIYRRTEGSFEGLVNLADIAVAEKAYEAAQDILIFIKENIVNIDTRLEAEQKLLQVAIATAATTQEREAIQQRYEEVLKEFKGVNRIIPLQIDYAHFLAFDRNQSSAAIAYLKELVATPQRRFDEARIKMELADILVLEEQFNQALIYYSQIQNKIKNNVLSQEARFKVAKTSYYKGDFDWAETQLNVLKASATQLIANDALELLLVIRDNSQEDSTQAALKKYARADLLAYKKQTDKALALYDDILEQHKGEKIEDEALLAQATLLESLKNYTKAEKNYQTIIEYYRDGILADDAYYRLARLYEGPLDDPEKAKQYYERIIFDLADSIYYVEAQKRFRTLRGDAIN